MVHALTRDARQDFPALAEASVLDDPDVQLALWILYELHYRGFDEVPADLEWEPKLIELRRVLERRVERELRAATRPLLSEVVAGNETDIGSELLELVASTEMDSPAAFLQRHGTAENLVDYLRERSVQQLKEADAQSFVLPRLEGAPKVWLAEVQYDEYGAGRPEDLHQELYAAALRAAGLDDRYGAYVDVVSALSLASINVMSMFALNRRLRGAAMGHFAAFEASSSVPSRKIAAGVERLGLPREVAAYFTVHVEADAVHEQVAARDICGALVEAEPSLRVDVLFGAACLLHLDALSGTELLERWSAARLEDGVAS